MSRRAVANEVVAAAREFAKSGKACEKHLADQLLVPLAMFNHGDRTLDVQKETKHYTTNRDVIAKFM